MINWRKKIITSFINHYFSSAPKTGKYRDSLRIRSSIFFPDFDTAHPDKKEAYIEAAQALERKGVLILSWEKGEQKERLKNLKCDNFKKLFREASKPYPQAEVDKIRAMLGARIQTLRESLAVLEKEPASSDNAEQTKKVIVLLEYLFINFNLREIGQGINLQIMEDLVRLFEFSCDPAQLEMVTARALSVLLYDDAKRLETLPAFYTPLLSRVQKAIPVPDISFLSRTYHETMISGKIIFEYKDAHCSGLNDPPLVNAKGLILNLPLESVETFKAIQLIEQKPEKTVLTIENKETFFALGTPQKCGNNEHLSRYDCFLYIGGYPNRAATSLIKLLADSGFTFHHAGDMDPDGILILQHIQDIAEKPVVPVKMDADSFNQYRAWGRILSIPMLRHAEKIRDEIKAIPGIAELLHRIEETGMGIEQEVVDYR